MTGLQALGALAVRIWAAEAIFWSIAQIGLLVTMAVQSPEKSLIDTEQNAMVGSIVWLAAGFLAWFAAPRLVRFAVPKDAGDGVAIMIGPDDFVRLGCFLIGIFYVVDVTPQLLNLAFENLYLPKGTRVPAFEIIRILTTLVQLALAFLLMVRPRRISEAIKRLRVVGLSKVESD